MDGLDVRILRAMGLLPYVVKPMGGDALRATYLARVVGVTPETVRSRIARLEAAGVIEGYDVFPNLRHFGLEAAAYLLVMPDEGHREHVRSELAHVEGLLEVTYYLGPHVCVDLAFQNPGEKARRLARLAQISGDPAPKPMFGWFTPPVERHLKPLDWRILQALRGDGRRSLVDVAREIGVGYRTVKRHHDRMAAEGSFHVKPIVNPAKDPGLVPVGLMFFFLPTGDADTVRTILQEFDAELVFAREPISPDGGNLDLLAFADSPTRVEELRQRGAQIPGVADVQAHVLLDVEPCTEWIDDMIDARTGTDVSRIMVESPVN